MKSYKLFLIISIFCLSSCVTYTTNQTGRTIDKNNAELGLEIGHSGYSEGGKFIPPIPIISTSLGVNYGILKDLDIGCKLDLIGHVSGSLKYQFSGDKESFFASSIGFSGGYLKKDQYDIFDFYSYRIQLFNSIHNYDNNIAFFFSPTFIFLNYSKLDTQDKHIKAPGYSVGLAFGDNNKITLGYTQYFTNDNIFLYTNPSKMYNHSFSIGCSFIFEFNPKNLLSRSTFLMLF